MEDNKNDNVNDSELLSALFLAKSDLKTQKWFKQSNNKNDLQKRDNISGKIFHYIYNAFYQQYFSLAWYDNMTYKIDKTIGLSKTFL